MRILHISTRLILGGSQENVVLSCEEQLRRGHDVHLAFGPIYGPEGSMLERVETFRTDDNRRTQTHVVPHLLRDVNPLADWRAKRELLDLINRLKPDVVHTHSSKAGVLGRLASWGASPRPATIHTIHGPPFMPLEGSPLKRLKVRLANHVYALAERRAARRCHAIVSVADAMTHQFLSRGIGTPALYTTVRSGIPIEEYLNAKPGETREEVRHSLGLADSDFVIGTVARLAEHKGHDDLLSALADDLRANQPWKLLWIGNGWWRERLLSRARAMGLTIAELDRLPPGTPTDPNAHILITGLVPPQRIPAMMRAMDVLAHPSTREGLPRTVPQALLCNVCPVAYDADGTGEACIEMRTGRLVPPCDLDKLREAIRWCHANPEQRQSLAVTGRAMCVEQFSVKAMTDGLQRVYDAVLARPRS